MDKKCKNCRFSVGVAGDVEKVLCKIEPPKIVVCRDIVNHGVWPSIHGDDFCAKFEPKDICGVKECMDVLKRLNDYLKSQVNI